MDLIEKILSRVKDLPTLPTVYSALCDAIAAPRSAAEETARTDPECHPLSSLRHGGGEPDRIVLSVHLGDILARALTLFIQPINIISICASLKEQEFKEIYEQADKIAQIVSGPITYLCIKTTR